MCPACVRSVPDEMVACLFLATGREELNKLDKQFDKTENDLKAVQNVGQIIGEVLKQLDEDRFIVKVRIFDRSLVSVAVCVDGCLIGWLLSLGVCRRRQVGLATSWAVAPRSTRNY